MFTMGELSKARPLFAVFVEISVISQIILVALLPPVHSTLIGDHICARNESFTELEQRHSTEPVRIREYGWCLGFPPRCSKYRTETKEIVKYQNVTKFREISECCEGFVQAAVNGSEEMTKCIPTCPNGCENGVCSSPYTCECFIGYQGINCMKACDKGTWGLKCSHSCNCPSFSCDPVSGVCIECLEGWTGNGCNTKCSKSFFGRDCKNKCSSCPEEECDSKTGECLITPTTTTSSTTTTTTTTEATTTTTSTTPPTTIKVIPSTTTTTTRTTTTSSPVEAISTPSSTSAHTDSLMHIHSILNTSVSTLEVNVKNLERQVDEHKRLFLSKSTTTPSTTPVDLTFIGLSTDTGALPAAVPEEAVAAAAGEVLISTHPDSPGEQHIVEVPITGPEVVVQLDHNHQNVNLQDLGNYTKNEENQERHTSILIALIAVLCVIATGCVGYVCLRRRCFIFPVKGGKVHPHATELNDVKAIDKPLPAIPALHDLGQPRSRSGSVKSVTFDEKLTYYGDGPGPEGKPTEGTFAYHFYDEVKYPPMLSDQKII